MKKKMYLLSITITFCLVTIGSALHAFQCAGPATANCLQCHESNDIHTFHLGDIVPLENCATCHCGEPGVSLCDREGLTHEPVETLCCTDCHADSFVVGSHIPRGGDCLSCHPQKIGVLFISDGIAEDFGLDWRVGFYDHLFPVWPAGFLAGGPKEGTTCYTVIHYANEAEAYICGVDEETPIDAFCNEYTGEYEVHSLEDHYLEVLGGDGTFYPDCYPSMLPAVVLNGHTTIDPVTQEVINGPHIDDPEGSGIGIADFAERGSFGFMEILYRFPNNKNPSHPQNLKWFYGNDTPGHLSYPPDSPELTNIKDVLTAAMPEVTFAFRHGSEAFMKNLDAYGNPATIVDSTETAIEELINDEQVDRIVVLIGAPDDANITRTGPCWLDEGGEGNSVVLGKTYRECLEDFTDGLGPNEQQLDLYYAEKPWEELLKIAAPETMHLVHEIDPTMDVTFAPAFNKMEDFEQAMLNMMNYTIAKYGIPDTASVKVIFAAHGLSAGWRNVAECDSYFRTVPEVQSRLITRVENTISWGTGTLEAVGGSNEMSEAEDDPVSSEKPFGDVWSTGERIDTAINGTYVNELGQVVDNGTGNFDYIIVVPITWQGDSTDTMDHGRAGLLGNSIFEDEIYVRDENDADGTHYDAGDFDSEYFTVKVYDGTGWPSVPGCLEDPDCEIHNLPVNKGSATSPTTVIITGAILSIGNSPARTDLTDAAVDTIIEAVHNPDAGGYPDLICEDIADGDGVPDESDNCPDVHNPEQEDTFPPEGNGIGNGCDCEGNFDCDQDQDGSDAAAFKLDFGRSSFFTPCTNENQCKGDFDCDVDVDGTDAALFKLDFGRSSFSNPCPICIVGDWCSYSPPSP